MSEKTDTIIEQLKNLTLLEASELVGVIEETFGVDASSGGGITRHQALEALVQMAVKLLKKSQNLM